MKQDEAEVTLLPCEDVNSHRKVSSSSWQFWKLIIIFLLFMTISVWVVFTMFPSTIEGRLSKSSTDVKTSSKDTKSSKLNTETCAMLSQNTNNNFEWSGFVEIVPSTLIYSAYYDDTNPGSPFVRMIGISETRRTFRPPRIFCHSRCDNTKTEEAQFHLVGDHKNRRHAAFIISCSFPRGLGRDPGSISLSAFYDQKRTKVITIPVQSTEDRRHIYNYTVCVPPIYGNEITPMNFVEFVEMNRILGATNFIIYNEYIHPELKKAIQFYQDKGVAKVLPWNLPQYLKSKQSIHYHGQQVSIEDCLYRSRGRTKWVGFHDLDEFIVPFDHSSVPSLLNAIDKSQSAGYCIRSVLLPRKKVLTPKKGDPVNSSALLTQHFLNRTTKVFRKSYRSKCIVDPRKVFEMGIHHIPMPVQDFHETWMNPNIALVFHYRRCNGFGDIIEACKQTVPEHFMLRYKKRLQRNVERIMRLIT